MAATIQMKFKYYFYRIVFLGIDGRRNNSTKVMADQLIKSFIKFKNSYFTNNVKMQHENNCEENQK